MATSVKLPRPEDGSTWAMSLVQALERYLNPFPEDQVGSVVLFKGTAPTGVLPADGVTALNQMKYPALFRQLGTSTMPLIPAPAGYTFGLVAK